MKVAIIPARGNSQRIPRKNIRDFHGKPIIAYSITTALESGLFDGGIWVSTEDAEIAAIAQQYGANYLKRPPELAEIDGAPDPGTQEVTRHSIEVLTAAGIKADEVCCIYATAPLMTAYYLTLGYRVLMRNPKAAFAYSVGGDQPRDAAQFYWGHARSFLDRIPLHPYAENVWKIMIPDNQMCDINTEADWARAEHMYQALHDDERIAYG